MCWAPEARFLVFLVFRGLGDRFSLFSFFIVFLVFLVFRGLGDRFSLLFLICSLFSWFSWCSGVWGDRFSLFSLICHCLLCFHCFPGSGRIAFHCFLDVSLFSLFCFSGVWGIAFHFQYSLIFGSSFLNSTPPARRKENTEHHTLHNTPQHITPHPTT